MNCLSIKYKSHSLKLYASNRFRICGVKSRTLVPIERGLGLTFHNLHLHMINIIGTTTIDLQNKEFVYDSNKSDIYVMVDQTNVKHTISTVQNKNTFHLLKNKKK